MQGDWGKMNTGGMSLDYQTETKDIYGHMKQ